MLKKYGIIDVLNMFFKCEAFFGSHFFMLVSLPDKSLLKVVY